MCIVSTSRQAEGKEASLAKSVTPQSTVWMVAWMCARVDALSRQPTKPCSTQSHSALDRRERAGALACRTACMSLCCSQWTFYLTWRCIHSLLNITSQWPWPNPTPALTHHLRCISLATSWMLHPMHPVHLTSVTQSHSITLREAWLNIVQPSGEVIQVVNSMHFNSHSWFFNQGTKQGRARNMTKITCLRTLFRDSS